MAAAAHAPAATAIHAGDVIDTSGHVALQSVPSLLAVALVTASAISRAVDGDLAAGSVTRAVMDTVAVIDCKGLGLLYL